MRYLRISKKRSKWEIPYAEIKTIFNAGRVKVTTIERVRVKNMFVAFCYNSGFAPKLNKTSLSNAISEGATEILKYKFMIRVNSRFGEKNTRIYMNL